jgi:hypothetical protein
MAYHVGMTDTAANPPQGIVLERVSTDLVKQLEAAPELIAHLDEVIESARQARSATTADGHAKIEEIKAQMKLQRAHFTKLIDDAVAERGKLDRIAKAMAGPRRRKPAVS